MIPQDGGLARRVEARVEIGHADHAVDRDREDHEAAQKSGGSSRSLATSERPPGALEASRRDHPDEGEQRQGERRVEVKHRPLALREDNQHRDEHQGQPIRRQEAHGHRLSPDHEHDVNTNQQREPDQRDYVTSTVTPAPRVRRPVARAALRRLGHPLRPRDRPPATHSGGDGRGDVRAAHAAEPEGGRGDGATGDPHHRASGGRHAANRDTDVQLRHPFGSEYLTRTRRRLRAHRRGGSVRGHADARRQRPRRDVRPRHAARTLIDYQKRYLRAAGNLGDCRT